MEQVARNISGRGALERDEELLEQGCGRTLGRYTLLRRIATGGMAEVYVARAAGVNGFAKRVAIKKILPQYTHNRRFIEMLLDEAKISVSLTHPNIAQVYELGMGDDEAYFIVMEYVEGPPLSRVLGRFMDRGESMPVQHAVHIISEVAKGLDHAHKQVDAKGNSLQIVHRDISPQNVLVSYQGNIKLIDFGIARAQGRAVQTGHGVIKGKLRYLAPEISQGIEPDGRADLFCCGLVLFELLTGEPYYAPTSDIHALELTRKAEFRSARAINPNVPEELDRILRRALERDRDQRYADAKELFSELRIFLNRFDPLFNESELGDALARMFADELIEGRALDTHADEVAGQAVVEDPTLALDDWERAIHAVLDPVKTELSSPSEVAKARATKSPALKSDPRVAAIKAKARAIAAPEPTALEMSAGSPFEPARDSSPDVDIAQMRRALRERQSRNESQPNGLGEVASADASRSEAHMSELARDLAADPLLTGNLVAEIDAAKTGQAPAASHKRSAVQAPTATMNLALAEQLGLVPEGVVDAPSRSSAQVKRDELGHRLTRPDTPRDSARLNAVLGEVEERRSKRGWILGLIFVGFIAAILQPILRAPELEPARDGLASATQAAKQELEGVREQLEPLRVAPPAELPTDLNGFDDPADSPSKREMEKPRAPATLRSSSFEEETEVPGTAPDDSAARKELDRVLERGAKEDRVRRKVSKETEETEAVRAGAPKPVRLGRGGVVVINSRPKSKVYVGGDKVGVTPLSLEVKPGSYNIVLEGPDGDQKTFRRKVREGPNPKITVQW